jgi:hypothetical protein
MPWNGSTHTDQPPTGQPAPGGLVQALDALRMQIPRGARAARSRRQPQYAGMWIQVSPTRKNA